MKIGYLSNGQFSRLSRSAALRSRSTCSTLRPSTSPGRPGSRLWTQMGKRWDLYE